MGELDRELGHLFAQAINTLLQQTLYCSDDIAAVGCHGQTVRHHPPSSGRNITTSFTLQITDPNTITEQTGITTVADFRRRDIAAGGEGAPLAPAFHAAAFGASNTCRAIINIGGFANISLLEGNTLIAGFDSGPGNSLLDLWIGQHQNQPYDHNGTWAASGRVHQELLHQLLSDPYFTLTGPRSTGKEHFNRQWLTAQLDAFNTLSPEDVQATLTELTAISISRSAQQCDTRAQEVYICGGGAHNQYLMERISHHFAGIPVASSGKLGIEPDWVEAATFAWLAYKTLQGQPGSASAVTGASGSRILGAIYPA